MKTLKIFLTICLNIVICNLFALETKKIVTAEKINNPPKIDGSLSDEVWKTAISATDFIQIDPFNGKQATFKTDVKFVYDDDALYIGVMMYDNSPDSIFTNLSSRDEINMSDFFGVYIDPFNDGLTAYGFFVTAAGVQIDIKAQEIEDVNWDAVWTSEVKIVDNGWIAEIKIPYSALRFSSQPIQNWGLNILRNVQRTREKSSWNFVDKNIDGFINQAGELHGIQNIVPPLRLSIMPYFSTYFENNTQNNSWTRSTKGGMDIKYGINESFTIDMMLIPDFGQVQSDDEVLNITPFETYYAEKRQFFTEGTELFNKGSIFYSRRIGDTPNKFYEVSNNLNENEKIVSNFSQNQLINATKFTGRTNKGTGIGLLNAMTLKSFAEIKDTITNTTREFITQPFTNYNVFVIDQSLKNNSFLSLINTNVNRFEDKYLANVTATDFKFCNKSKTYSLSGRGAFSRIIDSENQNQNGGSYLITFAKTSNKFRFYLAQYLESDKYNPNDLGYLEMNNSIGGILNFEYNFYNPIWKFVWWTNNVNLIYETLYKPAAYSKFLLATNSYATFKNYLTIGYEFNASLLNEHNYYETRSNNHYYLVPKWASIQGFMSSDYRKRFAIDIIPGYWKANETDFGGYWINVSPRLRVNDKLFILHTFSIMHERQKNYVGNNSTEIYFGKINHNNLSNTLTASYIFNNKQGISLKARQYWARAEFSDFYLLNNLGKLDPTTNFTDNPNVNYNAFNVDLIYTWNFAPGSELSIAWKNIINTYDNQIINSFAQNIKNTFDASQINNFSFKILYYIDYQSVKNIF